MFDYDVVYDSPKYGSMIIGNLTAETDRKALNAARKMYDGGKLITVARVVR